MQTQEIVKIGKAGPGAEFLLLLVMVIATIVIDGWKAVQRMDVNQQSPRITVETADASLNVAARELEPHRPPWKAFSGTFGVYFAASFYDRELPRADFGPASSPLQSVHSNRYIAPAEPSVAPLAAA
jgi:hypothetical protein